MSKSEDYPVKLEIDYPEKLDRFSTFFRIFMIIPIAIILTLVAGSTETREHTQHYLNYFQTGGIIFAATALMIIFRQKYPRWWFDWNLELTKFSTRVGAYLFLLSSEYPSTTDEQSVHISFDYPDAEKDLNRFLPIVKWFLAIPHYIVIAFLAVGVIFSVIIAWFIIIFTAKYPRGLFDFIVGFFRWTLRVSAYAFMLVTDKYPPFSFK